MTSSNTSIRKIKFQDLGRLHESIKQELVDAFEKTLATSSFIQGAPVRSFEEAFASFTGAPHCIGVANGTDAIELVLEALSMGQGDLVLVPSLTFTATAEAVVRCGGKPVFVDTDDISLCSELDQFKAAFESLSEVERKNVKALIVVHLQGLAVDVSAIAAWARDFNIVIVEDCAQAHGAKLNGRHVGTFGVAGTFSFYPGKNLGALGDAGAVITSDKKLDQELRSLRDHGRSQKYLHHKVGRNSRLDGLQAAFLEVKLRHLNRWTALRQSRAKLYCKYLSGIEGLTLPPMPPSGDSHVFHNFVIQINRAQKSRDALKSHLEECGIETGVHYPLGLHAQPAYEKCSPNRMVQTDICAARILSLPIDPFLQDQDIEYVCERIKEFFAKGTSI